MSQTDRSFDIGKLYIERGDFHLAIPLLKDAASQYFSKREFGEFLNCQNLLLRMYAEREEHEEIQKTKEVLQDLVLREGFELSSKTYYTLALCASYKGQSETALEYLQKSLSIALATDNKTDMCYAICGLAIIYNKLGRYTDALREIYNLQVFFQIIDLPDIKLTAQKVNGRILRSLKRHEEALVIFWACYEDLKKSKSLLQYIGLLYDLGMTYLELGNKDLTRTYLQLALKSMDPENMRLLYRATKDVLTSIGVGEVKDYDLIFDSEQNTVIEQKIGKVDFKNQFILLDLLKLFIEHPGEVYSKEALVEQIWHQNYDPAVHDNKIYVTIKRLRKLIEPDYEKPKYIFRSKNGYYLNKSAKVLLEQ
jgi:DNA-binding winged helix-turn-helix (wHTH) protein